MQPEPGPQTLFAMVSTEMTKWPNERLCYEDQNMDNGSTLRSIKIDSSAIVAQILLGKNNELLKVIYPQLSLH